MLNEVNTNATLVASAQRESGWEHVNELRNTLQSFNAGGLTATDLRAALDRANQVYTREGSWWDQGAIDNYWALKGQAERALSGASSGGQQTVSTLQGAIQQFRADGDRGPLNDALATARSEYFRNGTNWSNETRAAYRSAESTAASLLSNQRQRSGEAWDLVGDLRDAIRGFNSGGLTATDVQTALSNAQTAYDRNGSAWPAEARNNFLELRTQARNALDNARTEGPRVVSQLESAINNYYAGGGREQLNDALFAARQAYQARGTNWSEQARLDYRNTASRAADLLTDAPAAGARRTVDPGAYAGVQNGSTLTQVRLQEQQQFDGNRWVTTGYTAVGPHVSRDGQFVSERFKTYELRTADGQPITDLAQAQARARELIAADGITTRTAEQQQNLENRRRNPPQGDGSLSNPAALQPTQIRQAQPDNPIQQAQRAVGDFTEGLVNGRPGAAGNMTVDFSRATDYQILSAQTMSPAQSAGVNLRETLGLFVPFGGVVPDALSAADLANNPYKQEIYGRTPGDAAFSAGAGLALELIPLPGNLGSVVPSPNAVVPDVLPPVRSSNVTPNPPRLEPPAIDVPATVVPDTPTPNRALPPSTDAGALPPGGTPPRRPVASSPGEPPGDRPIQPDVLPPETPPAQPSALPTTQTLSILKPEELGLPVRTGRDGVSIIDPTYTGPYADFQRAAGESALPELRTVRTADGGQQVWAYDRATGQPVGFVPNARLANEGDRLWDIVRHNADQIADPGKRDAYVRRWRSAIDAVMNPDANRAAPNDIANQTRRLNEMLQADWQRQMRQGAGEEIMLPADDPRLPENRVPPWQQRGEANERLEPVQRQDGSVTYSSDGAMVRFQVLDQGVVQRAFNAYDEVRVNELIARGTTAPTRTSASGTPFQTIPVRSGPGSENLIPSLGELDTLSQVFIDPMTGTPSEVGLVTRIGDPTDVLLVIGSHNRLPIPDGYRLAVHVHPAGSPPSPEDFNFSTRPNVIPGGENRLIQGTGVETPNTTNPATEALERRRPREGTLPAFGRDGPPPMGAFPTGPYPFETPRITPEQVEAGRQALLEGRMPPPPPGSNAPTFVLPFQADGRNYIFTAAGIEHYSPGDGRQGVRFINPSTWPVDANGRPVGVGSESAEAVTPGIGEVRTQYRQLFEYLRNQGWDEVQFTDIHRVPQPGRGYLGGSRPDVTFDLNY